MVPDGYYYAVPLCWCCAARGLAHFARLGRSHSFARRVLPMVFSRSRASGSGNAGGDRLARRRQGNRCCSLHLDGERRTRISIFLNVFDVHVNRSPIAGVIRDVRYQSGKFLNAMAANSADENEQNIVTVDGEGQTVIFKQIAGLIARRIVFNHKVGDQVARGQRVGLIKFGSRVDVVVDASAKISVKVGDRVKGGESVLAHLSTEREELVTAASVGVPTGAR